MAEINTSKIVKNKLRVSKLREYLFTIIDELLTDTNYQINTNMLSTNPINYSLDKIPTQSTIEKWVTGTVIHRDVYSFRSRLAYGQDTITNLLNAGFFEIFEQIIETNNKKGILPDIQGIKSIECLNCGSLNNIADNTAEWDIQLQITYREES